MGVSISFTLCGDLEREAPAAFRFSCEQVGLGTGRNCPGPHGGPRGGASEPDWPVSSTEARRVLRGDGNHVSGP